MSVEWAVRWKALGTAFPEVVHAKKSEQDAEDALKASMAPGVVVSREVTEWKVKR